MTSVGSGLVAFVAVGAFAVSAWSAPPDDPARAAKQAPAKTTQARPTDDRALADQIEKKLQADASLGKFDIDVAVQDGIATLTGTVRTDAEKLRAARDAQVPGIRRVENRITMDKDAGKGVMDRLKETTGTAGQKTRSSSETAGQRTKEGVSRSGEVITDAWITTKVHGQFVGEDLLKASHIDVDTKNNVVTLTGTVKSQAGRARAVEIAKATEGVAKVVDKLTVR